MDYVDVSNGKYKKFHLFYSKALLILACKTKLQNVQNINQLIKAKIT